ncbi:MAG: arginase family protein [archaeon]
MNQISSGKKKIKYYTADEILKCGVHEVSDSVMSVAKNWGALYISVDIDVVDPAFAPGTGYLESCGISGRELLLFLSRLRWLKNLVAVDLVEINPNLDPTGTTVDLGARLISSFILA